MTSGLPVVLNSDRCFEGVVKSGINGYTFKSKDEFYDSLDLILGDEEYKKLLRDEKKLYQVYKRHRKG